MGKLLTINIETDIVNNYLILQKFVIGLKMTSAGAAVKNTTIGLVAGIKPASLRSVTHNVRDLEHYS
jgi:hypothetical protein